MRHKLSGIDPKARINGIDLIIRETEVGQEAYVYD
jgi:hypothetical protein